MMLRDGKITELIADKLMSWNHSEFNVLATSHIANRFEHRVVYYGWWSNKTRGMRKKREWFLKAADEDFQQPVTIEPVLSSNEYRKKWA